MRRLFSLLAIAAVPALLRLRPPNSAGSVEWPRSFMTSTHLNRRLILAWLADYDPSVVVPGHSIPK